VGVDVLGQNTLSSAETTWAPVFPGNCGFSGVSAPPTEHVFEGAQGHSDASREGESKFVPRDHVPRAFRDKPLAAPPPLAGKLTARLVALDRLGQRDKDARSQNVLLPFNRLINCPIRAIKRSALRCGGKTG